MVTEVRLYIEGGGDSRTTKTALRRGFSDFLKELIDLARERRIRWNLIACGCRNDAYNDFLTALEYHSDAFNLLLIDSESEITSTNLWQHLFDHDKWEKPKHATNDNVHFMAHCMESWIIADVNNLEAFYGKDFHRSSIPNDHNVERIIKSRIFSSLENATRHTLKGLYHKTEHGFKLLSVILPSVVMGKAPYCRRLFDTLRGAME